MMDAFAGAGDMRRASPFHTLLLALVTLLALLPGIAQMPPIDRDESRYVQATKQMAETGDYVDIRFQDEARYKKPIGIYWLQSAAVALSGEGAAAPIWVYRLVSVLAATAAVAVIYWLGTGLFGQQAGILAALVFAATLGLALEGRMAKTDATLVALVVLAQAALARIYIGWWEGRTIPTAMPWLFWAAQGCAILIKGPIGLIVSILTVVTLLVARRSDWRWLRDLRVGPGILLMAAISLPWLAAITWKSGGAFWQESVGNDLLAKVTDAQESHGAPPGYFMLAGALYLWPFAAVGVAAALRGVRSWSRDPRLLFLLAWYVPLWLVFELFPTKLPHYLMPGYPALALLASWALTLPPAERDTPLLRWQVWLTWLGIFGHVTVTLILAVGMVAAPIWLEGRLSISGVVAAGLILLAGWFAFARDGLPTPRRLIAAAGCAFIANGVIFSGVAPSIQSVWLSPRVAAAVAAHRACETGSLSSVGYGEPSLVFLLGTETRLTDAKGAAEALLADPVCGLALLPASELAGLNAALSPSGRTAEPLSTVEGLNYSKGRKLSLTLYRLRP